MAEIQLHSVWKNKRPPYWNSISGCDFHHITVIGVRLRQTTKFRSNRTNRDVVMIFKMAAAAAQYCMLPVSYWIPKVNIYPQTKFHRHALIHGWDITTPVWKNNRSSYWNSTSGFDFYHITVLGMSFCIRLPNFVQIGPSSAEI